MQGSSKRTPTMPTRLVRVRVFVKNLSFKWLLFGWEDGGANTVVGVLNDEDKLVSSAPFAVNRRGNIKSEKTDFSVGDAHLDMLKRFVAANNTFHLTKSGTTKRTASAVLTKLSFAQTVKLNYKKTNRLERSTAWVRLILFPTSGYVYQLEAMKSVWRGSVDAEGDGMITDSAMYGDVASASSLWKHKQTPGRLTETPDGDEATFTDWCVEGGQSRHTFSENIASQIFDQARPRMTISAKGAVRGISNPYGNFSTSGNLMHAQRAALASYMGTAIHLALTFEGLLWTGYDRDSKLYKGMRNMLDDCPQITGPIANLCHKELRQFVSQLNPNSQFDFVSADDTYLLPCIFKKHGQMIATYPDGLYKITQPNNASHYLVYELKTRWSGSLADEDLKGAPAADQLEFVRSRDPKFTDYNVQAAVQALAASFVHGPVNYMVQVASVPPANTVSVIDISTFVVQPTDFRAHFGISLQNAVYKHLLMSDAYEYYSDDVLRIKRTSHAMLPILFGCASESYDDAMLITLIQEGALYTGYRKWHPWVVEDKHRNPRLLGKRFKAEKPFIDVLPSALVLYEKQVYKPTDQPNEYESWEETTVKTGYADMALAYNKKVTKTTFGLTLLNV